MKKKFINKKHAKSGDYRDTLEEIEGTNKCPFCPDNFKYHKQPILRRVGDWMITENSWPYPNTAHHYILVPNTHKERFEELTNDDFSAVSELVNWIVQEKQIPGAALALRFGDSDFTGASVTHLHFQLLSPQQENGDIKVVQFPVG